MSQNGVPTVMEGQPATTSEQQGEVGQRGEPVAAWLCGVNDLQIRPYPTPPLGPKDVRVGIRAVGICGSDVHFLKHMRIAHFVVQEPMVIGHESAGIVLEVGASVRHLRPGDRVALEPGLSCASCARCRAGRYNLCPEMRYFATPPVHGSLATEVVHPADLAFRLPEVLSFEEGAMCEPLSVAVYACRRAQVEPGTRILVLGAGPIGLLVMLAAKAFGAGTVVMTDVSEERLQWARKLGADAAVRVSTDLKDTEAEVQRLLASGEESRAVETEGLAHGPQREQENKYFDCSIDCAGFTKTMRTALAATASGGRVCLVGMAEEEMTLPVTAAAAREVDIVGVFRYHNTYPLCIELMRSKRVDVRPLVTHRFKFPGDSLQEAFETSARGANAVKVMFQVGQ